MIRNRLREDEGFTLVELMVYIALFMIVGTMVVVMMMNGYRTQLSVTQTTENTGGTQNAVKAIDRDIRFASAYRVTGSGSLLLVRTWVGDASSGSYSCRGWFYDNTSKVLRRATTAAQTSGATTTSARNWPIYLDGVTATTAFADVTKGVRVRFSGSPDAWGRETKVDTSIVQRPQDENGSSPCFS